MSYDITSWKTKRLLDLKIPVAAFFRDEVPKDWQPRRVHINTDGDIVFSVGAEIRIIGRLDVDGKEGRKIKSALAESTRLGLIPSGELGFPVTHSAFLEYTMVVTEIRMSGQFSGKFWNECFKGALAQSQGILVAARVWAGGEYIDQLLVRNGEVIEEEISL